MAGSLLGRQLGEFVVRERIGQGGFGAVYRAEQPLLAREAVIKVLHGRHNGTAAITQRFLREARIASRIDHPYAAHIYAFGLEPDGLMWIAMEYVRGRPLDAWLREHGPIPLPDLAPLLDRLAEVVHTAHERGIIHRDIKPANVMVIRRAGQLLPKLLDLGIAKLQAAVSEPEPTPPEVTPTTEDETLPGTSAAATRVAVPAPTARAASPPEAEPNDALTQPGAIMGSPPYMAPELWAGGTGSDRSDLYALAVLAYEALTGRRPFAARTPEAMREAHRAAPVPPVGAPHPDALDGLFARALAKDPGERPASALELAAAFRRAGGLDGAAAELPRLPVERSARFIEVAPQPLAESVAALHVARNPHEARDAILAATRAMVRLIASYALAALAHLGGRGDLLAVDDRVRRLRRAELGDDEWLELAREACRPFAAAPGDHPLPALVRFFFPDAGVAPALALAELIALEISGHFGPDQVRVWLRPAVGCLDRALSALEPLCAWRVVIPAAGRGALWTGVRRAYRPEVALTGGTLVDGRPVLVDGAGGPVLSLWPLAQVLPPQAGAPPELFLFDGPGRHAARLVALPAGFFAQDAALWDWFADNLIGGAAEDPAAGPEVQAPYLGLHTYGAEHAERYFGREQEAIEAANRLRAEPFLCVVGASGAGKSSFVHAGLLPSLPADWRAVTLRPGPTPLAALRARLVKLGVDDASLAHLADDPELAGAAVREAARAGGFTAVVVVDQLEELVTQVRSGDERRAFAEALAGLARSAADPVRLVATLRDDFLMRVQALPALRPLFDRGVLLVGVPARSELLRIVVEPARRAGHDFDDPSLPGEMVDEVAGQPGALPLLSFTALGLWQRRDRQFRRLTRRAYREMNGVGGALAQHADAVILAMTREEQRLARQLFRQLITAEGTRAAMAQRELVALLAHPSAEAVLGKLVDARLLVSSDDGSVEIVHEALLAAWPRLAAWQREDAEGARLRDQLRAAARQWDSRGRPRGLLWRDEALAELTVWRARHAPQLTEVDAAFAAESVRQAARGRRARVVMVSALLVILMVAVGVLLWANARTQRSEAALKRSYLEAVEEQGRQALLAGRSDEALARFVDVLGQGAPQTAGLRFMVAHARRALAARVATLRGHQAKLRGARFSPDGARLLTAAEDGTAILWDARSHQALLTLRGCPRRVFDAQFQGDELVTTCDDGRVRIYGGDGVLRRAVAVAPEAKEGLWVAFGGAGGTAVTAGGRELAGWDPATWTRRWRVESPQSVAFGLALGPDGAQVALIAGPPEYATHLHRVDDGSRVHTLASGAALWVEADATGRWLVTPGLDGVVRVWDAAEGTLAASLIGHTNSVDHAAFHPGQAQLATASRDGSVFVWELPSGRQRLRLQSASTAPAMWVRFSPDGARVAVSRADGSAALWDAERGHLLASLPGHAAPAGQVIFSPDGARLVTASYDRSAIVWQTEQIGARRVAHAHAGAVNGIFVAGDELVSYGDDRRACRWGAASGEARGELTLDAPITAGAPGREPVLGTATGRVVLWPAGGPPRDLVASGPAITRLVAGGPWLVLLDAEGGMRVVDREGRVQLARREEGARLIRAAFRPDGAELATGDSLGTVRVHRAPDFALARTLPVHRDAIYALGWTPAGLFTAGGDATAVLLDGDGQVRQRFTGHLGPVMSAQLDGAGRRLLTTSQDSTGRIWDLAGGAATSVLRGHTNLVPAGAFSGDGELVLTGGDDQLLRVWEPRTGREVGRLAGHQALIYMVGFTDATTAYSAGNDGSIFWWDIVAPGIRAGELEALAALAAGR